MRLAITGLGSADGLVGIGLGGSGTILGARLGWDKLGGVERVSYKRVATV